MWIMAQMTQLLNKTGHLFKKKKSHLASNNIVYKSINFDSEAKNIEIVYFLNIYFSF